MVVAAFGVTAAQSVPDRVRWSAVLGAPPEGGPVVAGSTLVIPVRGGGLSAHNLESGALMWSEALVVTQPLASDNDRVYVAAGDTLAALKATDGAMGWRVSMDGEISAPPLAQGGWVVVAAAGDLAALRAADGAVVWRQPVGAVEFRPSLLGDLLVVSSADGYVSAFDLVSGARQWQLNLGARPTEPLAAGDRVYVGTEDKWFYALHASHGRRDWRWAGALVRGRAAVDDRHVYFAGMDNVLRALDRRRGALRWRQGLAYRPATGPVVMGDGVVVPGYVEALPVFRRSDGTRSGQIRFAASLTALPVFSSQEDGLPMVYATLGSLADRWTVTRIDASLVPLLQVQPLEALPGEVVPSPQLPRQPAGVTPLEDLPGDVVRSRRPHSGRLR
jgi:outer membrane protein assembly factor BamB